MLSVEPWGLKPVKRVTPIVSEYPVSVLSVEPWGLKLQAVADAILQIFGFSALGRAVGFEAVIRHFAGLSSLASFSALGRAVGFEAAACARSRMPRASVSVLSVEPWGLKPARREDICRLARRVSVLSVEPWGLKPQENVMLVQFLYGFQCSRSSRGV